MGIDLQDLPRLRLAQRPGHRGAARGRCTRPVRRPAGAGLVDGGLRRGRLPLRRARRRAPRAARPGRPGRRAASSRAARAAARRSSRARSPRTRRWTRAASTRRPSSRQEHLVAGVGPRDRGARWSLLRYHNVYGPGMPRDTPYAGVAAIFRSRAGPGEAPRVFEDGGQRRDFVHVDDVPPPTSPPPTFPPTLPPPTWPPTFRPPRRAGPGRYAPTTWRPGWSAPCSTWPGGCPPRWAALPRRSPGATGPATSATSPPTPAGPPRELGWRARVDAGTGIRELARAGLTTASAPGAGPPAR